MDHQHLDAAASASSAVASVAYKATWTGAAATILGAMSDTRIVAATGLVLGIAGFILNWFYRHKEYRLRVAESRAKLARLHVTGEMDTETPPGTLTQDAGKDGRAMKRQRGAVTRRSAGALGAIAVAAALLAAPFEGTRFIPYVDPPGVLTVCTGHTGPDVVAGRRYTVDECKALLAADMLTAVNAVESCQPGLPDQVLLAFSDAAYNVGPRIACDPAQSRAASLLRQQRYAEACRELPRWDKARVAGVLVSLPGLAKRRAAEMELCLSYMAVQ